MTDSALEAALFAAVGTKQGRRRRAEPDWAVIHHELKRKHVTLAILWDEYIERYPDGYCYSRFCELYRGWASRLSVAMRQARIDSPLTQENTVPMKRTPQAPAKIMDPFRSISWFFVYTAKA